MGSGLFVAGTLECRSGRRAPRTLLRSEPVEAQPLKDLQQHSFWQVGQDWHAPGLQAVLGR